MYIRRLAILMICIASTHFVSDRVFSQGTGAATPQISFAVLDWDAPDWTNRWYPGNAQSAFKLKVQPGKKTTVNVAGKFRISNTTNEGRMIKVHIEIFKWNPGLVVEITNPVTGQVTISTGSYEAVGSTDVVSKLCAAGGSVVEEVNGVLTPESVAVRDFTVGVKKIELGEGQYKATLSIESFQVDEHQEAVGAAKTKVLANHIFYIEEVAQPGQFMEVGGFFLFTDD